MNISGMLRVQNEARWIVRVVRAIAPLCRRIFVLDDHSTDATALLCRMEGCTVIPSPFEGHHQGRDMQFLYDQVMDQSNPAWIINPDGDEELEPSGVEAVRAVVKAAPPEVVHLSFQILYLWDRVDQIRVDGVYGQFRRRRMFRAVPGAAWHEGTIHNCGAGRLNIPGRAVSSRASFLHYGYLHRKDRLRKYEWHNRPDMEPNNEAEDGFRHVVQGDVPEVPVGIKLKHAGPLQLRRFAFPGLVRQ